MSALQRYYLRAGEAYTVIGAPSVNTTATGYLHNRIADPDSGECIDNPDGHPLLVGRIPLDVPACEGDGMADLSPNPCLTTIDDAFYGTYDIEAVIAGTRSCEDAFNSDPVVREVPWGPDYRLPLDALVKARGRVTYLANPNAPTGTLVPFDEVARLLERSGVGYYLVEIGGEVRSRGYSPRGDVWRVGIERPDGAMRRRVVGLDGVGLATSGDYRIFFESDGVRYPHIIDPRTGRPVGHGLASVTVIAKTAMQADALSTALMVMGPKDGFEMARDNAIPAFFIAKSEGGFAETATEPFVRHLIA